MTKQELLAMMRLLSALESWAFANNKSMPDYLHEQLGNSLEVLEREILYPEPKGPLP